MKVTYSQKWLIPTRLEQSWNFFLECLNDSAPIESWPNWLSTLKSQDGKIQEHGTIQATYKVGPFKSQAYYTIQELVPMKKIVYRTTEEHPLIGRSEITLKPKPQGTLCHWSGEYKNRNLTQVTLLMGFKLFFEPLFFGSIKDRTKHLK